MPPLKTKNPPIVCRHLYYRDRTASGDLILVKIPSVTVSIRSEHAFYKSFTLVDSGSYTTFLQKEDDDLLRLKNAKDRTGKDITGHASGAGGRFECDIKIVPELSIMDNKEKAFHVYRGLQVFVPKDYGHIPYTILGRDTVFRHYHITFREGEKTIALQKA